MFIGAGSLYCMNQTAILIYYNVVLVAKAPPISILYRMRLWFSFFSRFSWWSMVRNPQWLSSLVADRVSEEAQQLGRAVFPAGHGGSADSGTVPEYCHLALDR